MLLRPRQLAEDGATEKFVGRLTWRKRHQGQRPWFAPSNRELRSHSPGVTPAGDSYGLWHPLKIRSTRDLQG